MTKSGGYRTGEKSTCPQAAKPSRHLGEKVSWSLGSVADQFVQNGVNALALPFYNVTLGLDARLLGVALALPRFIDAIIDPLVGTYSDNTRGRWGRRKPYILIGGIASAVAFALLWMPIATWPERSMFLYFLIVSTVLYLAYAIFAVPRNALGYELFPNDRDRISLFAINAIIASAVGLLIPWLYKASFLPIFAGPMRDPVVGIRWVATLSALLMAASVIPCILLCREPTRGIHQPKVGFIYTLRLTAANVPFLLLCVVVLIVLLAVLVVGPLQAYIAIYYIANGNIEYGAFLGGCAGTAQAIMGLLSAPLIARVARCYDKRTIMLGGIILALAGFAASWWFFTPRAPWMIVVPVLLIQPGLACVWVLSGAMISDVCDYDQLQTGLRREGAFGGIFALVTKVVSSGVTLLASYILVWAGFGRGGSDPATGSMITLRILFAAVPMVLLAVAAVFLLYYPLTRARMQSVREELEACAAAGTLAREGGQP